MMLKTTGLTTLWQPDGPHIGDFNADWHWNHGCSFYVVGATLGNISTIYSPFSRGSGWDQPPRIGLLASQWSLFVAIRSYNDTYLGLGWPAAGQVFLDTENLFGKKLFGITITLLPRLSADGETRWYEKLPDGIMVDEVVQWEAAVRQDRSKAAFYHDWCAERGWKDRADEMARLYADMAAGASASTSSVSIQTP